MGWSKASAEASLRPAVLARLGRLEGRRGRPGQFRNRSVGPATAGHEKCMVADWLAGWLPRVISCGGEEQAGGQKEY